MRIKSLIPIAIICTLCLVGCSSNSDNNVTEQHKDTFVALEVTDNTSENNDTDTNTEDTKIISDNVYTQEELESATVFKEPEVDLGDYYSESYTQDEITDNDKINDEQYTESNNINIMIGYTIENNGYTSVEILDSWRDAALNVDSYYILFDGSELYCFSEDDNGEVFINKNDYEYYLEING